METIDYLTHAFIPPTAKPDVVPKKKKTDNMSGRQQRGSLIERVAEDSKGKGLDGPHFRVTDQDWKMSEFADPLLPRPDLSMSLPPGMDRETERGLWAYLQNAKDRAKEEDEKKAASS